MLRCKLWSSANFRKHTVYILSKKGFLWILKSRAAYVLFFFSICNHQNMPKALKRSASLSSSLLFIMQSAQSIYNQQQHRNVHLETVHTLLFHLHKHTCTLSLSCSLCASLSLSLSLSHTYTRTHTLGKDSDHHDNRVSRALHSLRVRWCSAARPREGCLCGRTGVRIESP